MQYIYPMYLVNSSGHDNFFCRHVRHLAILIQNIFCQGFTLSTMEIQGDDEPELKNSMLIMARISTWLASPLLGSVFPSGHLNSSYTCSSSTSLSVMLEPWLVLCLVHSAMPTFSLSSNTKNVSSSLSGLRLLFNEFALAVSSCIFECPSKFQLCLTVFSCRGTPCTVSSFGLFVGMFYISD